MGLSRFGLFAFLFSVFAFLNGNAAQADPTYHPGWWWVYSSLGDPEEVDEADDPYTACSISADQWLGGTELSYVRWEDLSLPSLSLACYFPSIVGGAPWNYVTTDHECPSGYSDFGWYCLKTHEHEYPTPATCANSTENPIQYDFGGKVGNFTDYTIRGAADWPLKRYYRSLSVTSGIRSYGYGWSSSLDHGLILRGFGTAPSKVHYVTPDGSVYHYIQDSGGAEEYPSPQDLSAKLSHDDDYVIWTLAFEDGRVFTFRRGEGGELKEHGRVETIRWGDGYERRYYYGAQFNAPSLVIDSYGRWVKLNRDDHVIHSIETSDGARIDYEYDVLEFDSEPLAGSEELIEATVFPPNGAPSRTEIYHREHEKYRRLVTGVTDANGVRSHTWTYDVDGRSVGSELANGVEAVTVSYDDANRKRTLTNALGKQTTVEFDRIAYRYQPIAIDGAASANCIATNSTLGYDSAGKLSDVVDENGNTTNYAINDRNLEISRTEAVGTPEERTITTTWHPTRSLPTQIVRPGVTVDNVYGDDGELLTRTETDTTSHSTPYSTYGETRVTSYAYQAETAGDIATVNLPITNPGAETGDVSGWNQVNGEFKADDGGHTGGYKFIGGEFTNPSQYQDIAIPIENFGDVDAESVVIQLHYWRGSYSAGVTDQGWLEISFLDAADVQIGDILSTTHGIPESWTFGDFAALAPAGTRKVRLAMFCVQPDDNKHCHAYFDDLELNLIIHTPHTPRLLTAVDGPMPGVGDTVSYGYDSLGLLATVTNELGHLTQIVSRNASGQPTEIEDPNGVRTELAYDDDGRIETVTVNPGAHEAVTSIDYDALGLIRKITPPDGAWLDYEYDDARRLIAIENAAGERVEYTRGLLGGVTAIDVLEAFSAPELSQTRTYDELGRVLKLIGADYGETVFSYDAAGNVETLTDPRSELFSYAYDGLNRLIKETDADLGETEFGLDASDDTTSVEDAENLTTSYVRNGFGDVIQTSSPDTGVTVYYYDERGLVTQMTDARGIAVNYAYDDAGRITAETYPASPAEDVAYAYDSTADGNQGVGRLTSVADNAGSTRYVYDERGYVTSETRIIGSKSYTTAYQYDAGDKPTKITYPSGRIVDISYDAAARINNIDMRADAGAPVVSVLSDIDYFPLAGNETAWALKSANFGNGLQLAVGHDLDGRLQDIDVGPLAGTAVDDLSFGYDLAGNITSITDNLDGARSESYQYDGLSRLTQAAGAYGTIDYAYDLVGNRTTRVKGGVSETYGYGSGTHRLTSVTSATVRTLTYDAAGNLKTDDKGGTSFAYAYDDAGRMKAANDGAATSTTYAYDAFEQRILKTVKKTGPPQPPGGAFIAQSAAQTTIHYVYDLAGRLIAEHSGLTGAALREYVWLGLMPVAYVNPARSGAVYYVHADQAMRPRKLTDSAGAVVWDRIATPFGEEHSVTGSLTQNLQFPGQIEDNETDLFQNWRREYDPSLGRYVQSDPVGLMGGINTYAYVGGNPVTRIDPTGEFLVFAAPIACAGGGCQAAAAGAAAAIGAGFLYLNQDAIGGDFAEIFGNLSKPANDDEPAPICKPAAPPPDEPVRCIRKEPKEGIPTSSGARLCRYSCPDGSTRSSVDTFRGHTNVCAPEKIFIGSIAL